MQTTTTAPAPAPPQATWLTLQAAAAALGVTGSQFRRLARSGFVTRRELPVRDRYLSADVARLRAESVRPATKGELKS